RRRAHAASPRRGSAHAQGALPHPGLLSAHRRHRVERRHAAGDHPGDAPDPCFRAPGPGHRLRCRELDGEEKSRGLFLMTREAAPVASDFDGYLRAQQQKSLLRFITCGSVDDGKSTLIGRLLYESNQLFEDQLAALAADSKKMGTQGEALDFALLLDGLTAEREQGITIDVAYRFFATERRKYIVADTPVLIVDARKGALTQTRRHCYIAGLLGIRHILVAVNKMDLIDHAESPFRAIVAELTVFAQKIGIDDVTFVPVSALHGDNVVAPSANMPWYRGPTLLGWLETVAVDDTRLEHAPFRLPVQWVNRPHQEFRGFAGTIVGGSIRTGERVHAQPSGRESSVAHIVTAEGDLEQAVAGQSIALTLADEIDVCRGDMLSAASAAAEVSDQFEATVVWMTDEPLLPGRPYLLKIGARTANVQIGELKYKVNVNSLEHVAAKTLALNEIGVCNLSLDHPIAFDVYRDNRDTGGFILIDRVSNNTVGAGLLDFALRRAHNIHVQALDLNKTLRAQMKGQRACVLWLTGLSGAGKSTI